MYEAHPKILLCCLSFLAFLPGCDTGGAQMAGIDRGGIRGTSQSGAVGAITGFGSVFVNGVRYSTDGAEISIGGQPTTEAALNIGYVVTIVAETSDGSADPQAVSIDFDYAVIGPLESIDAIASALVVLGQIVAVDASTSFGPGIEPGTVEGLSLLPTGQRLRVSGFTDADGRLRGTRIEVDATSTELEVTGIVQNVDGAAKTLQIGSLFVDYQSSGIDGFPAGMPANGDRVKVEGTRINSSDILIADSVELKVFEFGFEEGAELEIEGIVTSFASGDTFFVSGIEVVTDAGTIFENGNAAMLAENVRIEVEGSLDAAGILVADEIEFEPAGTLRVEANVDAVDAAAGTLSLLEIPIRVSASTVFEDKSPAELRPFGLVNIVAGDPLRVEGDESTDEPGTIIATRVIRMERLEEVRLRGIAENFAEPGFSILSVTIMTDVNTDLEDNFFSTAEGSLVEAQGNVASGLFLAEKVEIKD